MEILCEIFTGFRPKPHFKILVFSNFPKNFPDNDLPPKFCSTESKIYHLFFSVEVVYCILYYFHNVLIISHAHIERTLEMSK